MKNKRKVTQFVCVFFCSYLRKNQPDFIQWNIYMPVFSVLCINMCVFFISLAPLWRVWAVAMPNGWFSERRNYFHYHFFVVGFTVIVVVIFVKMEHTHIYINKNFVAQTFRCRHNALLFTLAQTIFLVSQYVCVLGCYCFYFPVVLPFFQLSFSLSLND